MKRNLSELLKAAPYPQAGCRGVSAELAQLQRYVKANDLQWLPTDGVSDEIGRTIGRTWRIKSYSPGGISRCSSYSRAWLSGAPEYSAAMAAAPAGLANVKGLLLTTPAAGLRDEWELCADGKRWKRVRRWRKLRGADTLVTGDAKRVGRYSAQVAYADSTRKVLVQTHTGARTDKRTRTVVRTTLESAGQTLVQAIWRHIKPTIVGPVRAGLGKAGGGPVTVTARILRRLCPAGWDVVVTPPSQGATPSPAFRERDTGEEYHFTRTVTVRSLVREAQIAFERRAAQKDSAELAAIVDRGEAAGVFICAADSYRAGNCRMGTASYAQRHGLDLGRHYTAAELAAQANGDTRFVRAAVIAGLRRERREMAAGVCNLADHRA
jgi:hypothetical protein